MSAPDRFTHHRAAFLAAKLGFERALAHALDALSHDTDYPAWIYHCHEALTPREQLHLTLGNIYYQDDAMDAREVEVNPGLIPASAPTLTAIAALNSAKTALQATLAEIDRYGSVYHHDPHFTRQVLSECGWGRLHRKQAVRTLPIITERLLKVGFTWAHTTDVQKITPMQARNQLEQLADNPYITRQIQLLDALPPDEPLAMAKQSALHIRANLLFVDATGGNARRQVRAHMPLFFAYRQNPVIPPFAPPKESSARDPRRLRRSDIKLEDTPFLPTLNVYRYLPAYWVTR